MESDSIVRFLNKESHRTVSSEIVQRSFQKLSNVSLLDLERGTREEAHRRVWRLLPSWSRSGRRASRRKPRNEPR